MATDNLIVNGWIIGRLLGTGANSFCHEAWRNDNSTKRCAKFSPYPNPNIENAELYHQHLLNELSTEVRNLQVIQSRYVVGVYDFQQDVEYTRTDGVTVTCYLMILELCESGSLFDYLYCFGRIDHENVARALFLQILDAISACHNVGVIHRDIKAQNIVLNKDFICKLIDFGCSKRWLRNTSMSTRVGTRGYQAPEQILKQKFTAKVDVFALGVVLFIMVSGRPPFREAKTNDRQYKYFATERVERFWESHPSSSEMSEDLKDLLNNMLAYQPRSRFTIEQVQSHVWCQAETELPQDDIKNWFKSKRTGDAQNAQKETKREESRQQKWRELLDNAGNNRSGDIEYPELPSSLENIAFELDVIEGDPGMDGVVFLQLAQEYVEQDLSGNVEYDQAEHEMFVTIQVKGRNGTIRAGMRINVFQQPESELFEEENLPQNVNEEEKETEVEEEEEEATNTLKPKQYVVFRRFEVSSRDDDAAFFHLQKKLRVLFNAFVVDED